MSKLATTAVQQLKSEIDAVTANPNGIPGCVFAAVNNKGEYIFEHASGKIGVGHSKDMNMESVFWIASCTKMITGIAAMQLVEQGKLALDDVELVEKLCPELKEKQVWDMEKQKLVPKDKGITLRMLLSHTAGFGYSFFDPRLVDYYGARGCDEFSGSYYDILSQPLVNQPGSAWEYGINIDWAGQLIERASGLRLNDYFQQHIFAPMNITHINMFPTDEMKRDLAFMNKRDPDGTLHPNVDGHLQRRPLYAETQSEKEQTFEAGGAGCFARPAQYCQIIATLLNDGTHPGTGKQILKKETVDKMFENQIPEFPNFARNPIQAPKPLLSNSLPEIYPESHDIPQGWGLTFFLHLKPSAIHSEGTGWWAGLPNLFWWCDRKKGIGGIIASQILPFGDPQVLGLWAKIEQGIYGNLE